MHRILSCFQVCSGTGLLFADGYTVPCKPLSNAQVFYLVQACSGRPCLSYKCVEGQTQPNKTHPARPCTTIACKLHVQNRRLAGGNQNTAATHTLFSETTLSNPNVLSSAHGDQAQDDSRPDYTVKQV